MSVARALSLGQMVRYGIAGTAAALTHLAVLAFLVELAGCPKTPASALGFVAGTLVNYALQHRFVFRRRGGHNRFFVRYATVTAATMVLNTALFLLFTDGFGVPYLIAQAVTIGLVATVNFLLNRHVTFATRPV